MRRWPALLVLGAYVAGLAALTLGPLPERLFDWAYLSLREIEIFESVRLGTVERAANVLLFVPFGLLLCLALPRVPRLLVWAGCASVSFAVELYQWGLPDRDASPVDIATNSLGAAIGVLLAAGVLRRAGTNARDPQTSPQR
jgi:glycopeptide antibiotics resistance protein